MQFADISQVGVENLPAQGLHAAGCPARAAPTTPSSTPAKSPQPRPPSKAPGAAAARRFIRKIAGSSQSGCPAPSQIARGSAEGQVQAPTAPSEGSKSSTPDGLRRPLLASAPGAREENSVVKTNNNDQPAAPTAPSKGSRSSTPDGLRRTLLVSAPGAREENSVAKTNNNDQPAALTAPSKGSRSSTPDGLRRPLLASAPGAREENSVAKTNNNDQPAAPAAPSTGSRSLTPGRFRRRLFASAPAATEENRGAKANNDKPAAPVAPRRKSSRCPRLRLPFPIPSAIFPKDNAKPPSLDAQVRAMLDAPLSMELPPPPRPPYKMMSCRECEDMVNEQIMTKMMCMPPPERPRARPYKDCQRRGRSAPCRSKASRQADLNVTSGRERGADSGAAAAAGMLLEPLAGAGDIVLAICVNGLLVCG